ncbi:MAG: capsular polysaccharide synthesis protein [Paludibacteraceae bacterium]
MMNIIRKIGLKCALLKVKHRYLTQDEELNAIASTKGTYDYLQRYDKDMPIKDMACGKPTKIIWTCWLQGVESAPPLVKRCIDSIRQYAGDYEVVVLNQDNLNQYVTIPDYIQQKYHKGIITPTHYSDIVRLFLLRDRGGIWIDATILLTDTLPSFVTDNPLFVFKNTPPVGRVVAASNFIASCSNHPIIAKTLDILLRYWQTENRLVSYSIVHLAFSIATEHYPTCWQQVPIIPPALEYMLMNYLSLPFSQEQFDQVCKTFTIHKLSYKSKQFHYDPNKEGTFYRHIIATT